MNPVAAKMAQRPEEYPCSSAQAHLKGKEDELVKVTPLLQLIPDRAGFLQLSSQEEADMIHRLYMRELHSQGLSTAAEVLAC